MKNLHTETLVKCRAACKLLRAKLCVLTAKLSLKSQPPIASKPSTSFVEMDLLEMSKLFKSSLTTDCKPKQPKRPKKSHRKSDMEIDEQGDERTTEFFAKLTRLLKYAESTFKQYENDYLRLEVLCLQQELYKLMNNNFALVEVEREIVEIKSYNPSYYKRICII